MKILVVSDKVVDWIYSSKIRTILSGTEVAIGCGDLPLEYLEFIVSSLDVPLYFVQGNHSLPDKNPSWSIGYARGCTNIHLKALRYRRMTFAGIEGSLKYNEGIYQYSQFEMWQFVSRLVPALLRNKIKYGKYLNVFITHAPAWGIHDQIDLPHQGIKAFRWLLFHFQPDFHLHGHIHNYRPDIETESNFGRTRVINAYGNKLIDL